MPFNDLAPQTASVECRKRRWRWLEKQWSSWPRSDERESRDGQIPGFKLNALDLKLDHSEMKALDDSYQPHPVVDPFVEAEIALSTKKRAMI